MAQKTSKSNEAYFARYKQSNLYAAHRKAKLEKLIKLQPNNTQLPLALKNVANYRRKSPNTPAWSHQQIATAKLFKYFVGKFDKLMFSQKDEDASAARKTRNENLFPRDTKPTVTKKRISDYSLAARAHNGSGSLVWS